MYEKIHAKTCAYETCIGPNLADACGANIQSMRAEIKDVPSAW